MELENLRLNSQKIVDSYIDKSDWRSSENSNQQFSFSGLLLHSAGTVMAIYALRNMYSPKIAKAHYNGEIHIHDLSHPIIPYCAGHSLRQILAEGLVSSLPVESKPAKHFRSALHQLVNYLGVMQHEFSGAQSLSSIDTYLAPFIANDDIDDTEIKQSLQEFVFNLNTPARWGGQTPFTNLTLDWISAPDLKDEYVIVGGETQEEKYSEFREEQEKFNKALIDIYLEGDRNSRPFPFPIPTINLTKDFPFESDNALKLFELTAKYGTPYFDNYINFLEPASVRSMCCRLKIPLNELSKKGGGGLFGAGEHVGSIGVCSINMNRIGFLAKNEEEYYERLEKTLNLAKQSLEIKRMNINESLRNGLLSFTLHYIRNFKTFFSTIGLVGMNESLLNFMGCTTGDEEGRKFTVDVLKFMREKLIEFQEDTGNLYALEATPAESASYRLARLDKKLCRNIKFYNREKNSRATEYLTNSTQLPVDFTDDPFEALELQEEIQGLYNSGTVFHMLIGEQSPISPELTSRIIKRIATDYHIPCFTWTPTFSICSSCGIVYGTHYKCPKCNSKCDVYSRVVGFYKATSSWNKGKQAEFADRKTFDIR